MIQFAFQNRYKRFLRLKHKNHLIFLIDRTQITTPILPSQKLLKASTTKSRRKTVTWMSSLAKDIYEDYKTSIKATRITHCHSISTAPQQPFLYKYKEIGAYKIIMGVQNRTLIESFSRIYLDSFIDMMICITPITCIFTYFPRRKWQYE